MATLGSLGMGCTAAMSPGDTRRADAGAYATDGSFDPTPEDPLPEDPLPEDPFDGGSEPAPDTGVPPEIEPPPSPSDAGTPPPPPPDDDPPVPPPGPAIPGAYTVDMNFATANIGRNYSARSAMAAEIDRIGDRIAPMSGPRFIGWQEIGEDDPCGDCEIVEIRRRFHSSSGWETRRPGGHKVPVTSKGANADINAREVLASPGWAGVSPTRYVTVVYYASRNISVLNTHFIAGAWSCRSNVAQRREYWRRAWNTLREEVAREHGRGRNVIVTGDLNRPRGANSCNPAWDPTSLHGDARVIGGAGIDYIFAVPAASWRFQFARRPDGSIKEGTIPLGIDGHNAHWVTGHFAPR